MKYISTLLIAFLFTFSSCQKEDVAANVSPNSSYTAVSIYNPIVGKWELGRYTYVCGTDTTTYPNEVGNYIEFSRRDTAFYTFNTNNSTGWSPYSVLDSSTFILGDTIHIISFDGIRLNTHWKPSNGSPEQWMTYKKVL